MTGAVRVLLVDDHTLVRAGVREILQKFEGVEVIDEAGTGREAIAMATKQKPDIVLMDISMPGLNGLEAIDRLREVHQRIKIIILSMHGNEEYVLRALRAGASGFMLKGGTPAELELAIRSVANGSVFLSPSIAGTVVNDYLGLAAGGRSSVDHLTPRQREVLQLLAEGKSIKEVAFTLKLSAKTVESHRASLMQRLNIRDTVGLVRYAMRVGLVSREI
jgi:DNA-binding NarL/FixJ family response regulator